MIKILLNLPAKLIPSLRKFNELSSLNFLFYGPCNLDVYFSRKCKIKIIRRCLRPEILRLNWRNSALCVTSEKYQGNQNSLHQMRLNPQPLRLPFSFIPRFTKPITVLHFRYSRKKSNIVYIKILQ